MSVNPDKPTEEMSNIIDSINLVVSSYPISRCQKVFAARENSLARSPRGDVAMM